MHTLPSKADLVRDMNRFPELQRLSPSQMAVWHLLHVAMPHWIPRPQLIVLLYGFEDPGTADSLTNLVTHLRRRLAQTRWVIETRRPGRRFGRKSVAYEPAAYRLVRAEDIGIVPI